MNNLHLLVPMNIEALVIDKTKAEKTEWVNLKPDFRAVYKRDQVLGQQLEKPLLFSPSTRLHKAGVHLHWALPDGLVHGAAENNGRSPEFPSIPNRWLIARFWDQGGEDQPLDIKCKAWIVESDTVVSANESDTVWPTLNAEKLTIADDYFVYVGKIFKLDDWPGETTKRSAAITAMGYGDPTFTAYYPACKGVLGFHDQDFADVKDGSTLSYMVVGWYADPSRDPLHIALTDNTDDDPVFKLDALLRETQWIYPGFAVIVNKVKRAKTLEGDLKESSAMMVRLQNAQDNADTRTAIVELQNKIAADEIELQRLEAGNAVLSKNLPAHLLCHGLLTGIQWKDTIDSGIPRGKPFGIALGETAVEALSALFDPRSDGLGKLLAAFQYDLLSEFEKPGGDSIVDYKMHERTFRPFARGIRWDLLQDTRPLNGSPEERTPPIPGDIRMLLEQLNISQRQINRLKRQRDSLRSELYATWYKKILNAKAQPHDDALNRQLEALQQEIKRVDIEIAAQEVEDGNANPANSKRPRRAEWETIQQQLETFLPGWRLQQFDEPVFWRPNDPVVLLAGEPFRRSARHGDDGRYRSNGRLLCRLSGQEITGINVKIPYAKNGQDVSFDPADLDQWCNPFAAFGNRLIPPEVINLFRESLLLTLDPISREKKKLPYDPGSLKRARAIVTEAYEKNEKGLAGEHAEEIKTLAGELLNTYLKNVWEAANDPDLEKPQLRYPETDEAGKTSWELMGTFPSPIIMNRWEKNPWQPLFLQWQVSWTPTYAETPRAMENWQLNDQGTGFNGSARPQGEAQVYKSTTLLTPSATVQFSDRLRQYNLSHNNEKLKNLQTAVRSMNILCQSLGGLTDQLLMRKSHLELRPLEPESGETGPQFSLVFDSIKDVDWLSPLTDGKFFPVRAGHLKLDKLWVIDAFGQFLQLETENMKKGLQPVFPKRLAAPDGSLRLEPRLAQPARLSLKWLPADRWEPEKEAATTLRADEEFNPVCGWLLANFLDQSLMIYDAKGYALGALQAVQRKSWREGVGASREPIESFHWIDIPGSKTFFFGKPAEKIIDPLGENANPHLRAFVKGLLSLTEGSGQAFSGLLDKINESLSAASGTGAGNNPNLALLIGKPLALVRAAIELELDGRMAYAQGLDDTETSTGDIGQLKFPLRLGDRREWQKVWLGDDGLAGFFLNQDYGQFYPAFGLNGRDDNYNKYGSVPEIAVKEPLYLTLLMDPSRGVCVTTGILPRTIFHLPYGDIIETLENKQVVFFTGPVVSPEHNNEIRMPQPSDLFGQWSWTHHPEVEVWREQAIADVQKEQGRFSGTSVQITEGWLKLITAPLTIRVLTVKGKNPPPAPAAGETPIPELFEVTAGEMIILSWAVIGAEELQLQAGASLLFKSHRHPLPAQYAIQVKQNMSFTLIATARNRETASKTINIILKET